MKKIFLASTLCAALFCGSSILSGCGDKMTDRHSEMIGGNQGPAVINAEEKGTPSNTNGMGQPLADGKINTSPDTMWNQSSPEEGKPF